MLDLKALEALKGLKNQIKEKKDLFQGQVQASNGRHGFIHSDDGERCYLPAEQMDRVLPGDRVEFSLSLSADGREVAELEALIDSPVRSLFGQVKARQQQLWLEPDLGQYNRWLLIGKKVPGLAEGQYIRAELRQHPFENARAKVEATAIIGQDDTAFIVHHFLAAREQLALPYPKELADVSDLQARLNETLAKRTDLTQLAFVTIDGASTQDMDDAIWLSRDGEGYSIKVAIADPSALVMPGSGQDLYAQSMSQSIYLPGQTLLMLPEQLSHQLCSLLPDQDRLALVFHLRLRADASLDSLCIEAAKIRSRAKLSYEQVSQFLDQGQPLDTTPEVLASLELGNELLNGLHQRRAASAIISQDRPDYRYRLDEQGVLTEILQEPRNSGQRLIEELMLLTNQAAAQWLSDQGTGLYTTNPGIRAEKLADIAALANQHWPQAQGQDLGQLEQFVTLVQSLAASSQSDHDRQLINRMLSRTELLAEPKPHFPLGFASYATVTSPIRKYSDLFNHRQIHALLAQQALTQISSEQLAQLNHGLQRSKRLEQEAVSWLLCDWLKQQDSQQLYSASIQGLTANGIQISLNDSGARGFIALRNHRGYQCDPLYQTALLKDQALSLGQSLQVRLRSAEDRKRGLMFDLA